MTGDARPPEATASDPTPPGRPRRRPPPGRISPEAMAAARGGVSEGLAWLGRAPEAKASLLYRAARLLVRFVCFGLFRFRIETSGQEHVPQRRLPARRRCASGLDGPVRRDARPARRAALLDPGERPVDLHDAVARVARPPDRRAAAGLARRRGHRPARRLGAGGRRCGRGLRPDAGGDGERPARAARCHAHRLGDHRAPDGCPGPAAGDGRHGGAVHRPADGVARAPTDGRRGSLRASRRAHRCPRRARARSWPRPAR